MFSKFPSILRRISSKSINCRPYPISYFSSSNIENKSDQKQPKEGFLDSVFGLQTCEASKDFKNRWAMIIPAFGIHMCIGSPFAWSLMADTITKEKGFVASAAADWSLFEASFPLSAFFLSMGLSAGALGKWQMKVGVRKAVALASVGFGGGIFLGAAGIHFHSLPLLYLGYGLMAGTGVGMSYTPPIQTLMQWFPDKKGIASGLTIAGFGSAALIFGPMVQYLMPKFAKLPTYLGKAGESGGVTTRVIDGRMFAEVPKENPYHLPEHLMIDPSNLSATSPSSLTESLLSAIEKISINANHCLVEVVSAGPLELSKLNKAYELAEGLYAVGSGTTGATQALAVMGASYFAVILASALAIKKPHSSFVPPAAVLPPTPTPTDSTTASTNPNTSSALVIPEITVDEAMKKSQFHLLGLTFFCLASGGMGLFSVAKPMMNEIFATSLPSVVNAAFAAKYVLMLSAGNLGGRLGWALISDKIGRRSTFHIFTFGSVPLFVSLPFLINETLSGAVTPLYGYCGATVAAITAFGGIYALLPAYESDIFGSKFVGAIHGRMLMYSAFAALAGPATFIKLRSIAEKTAIEDLLQNISPETFEATFGTGVDRVSELIAAKTLTINKLLMISPVGTLDPTPHLYDTTMYGLGGLMLVAAAAHSMVKPLTLSPPPASHLTTLTTDSQNNQPPVIILAKAKETKEEGGEREVVVGNENQPDQTDQKYIGDRLVK